MHTKPFNLEEAKAGKECITADGDAAFYKFTIDNKLSGTYHIFKGVQNGHDSEYVLKVKHNGLAYFFEERQPHGDLFMKCEEKEYWIATGNGGLCSALCGSEQEAIDQLERLYGTVKNVLTHKITRYE